MSTAIVEQETKRCPKCGGKKPRTDFYKDAKTKDGLYSCCKPCHNERTRLWSQRNHDKTAAAARARRAKDVESAKAYQRAYYAMKYKNDEAHLSKARKRAADWREANKSTAYERWKAFRERHRENISAKLQAYYQANKAKIVSRTKAYAIANPEKRKLHAISVQSRRRYRLLKSEEHFTPKDVDRLKKLQRMNCANCGGSLKYGFHVDHRIPVSKGGDNGPGNIELLCPECNIAKSAKLPHEFAQEQGRLI